MKQIQYARIKLDKLRVVEDNKKCCLRVNAVITKEGVYPYPDGRAFKSKAELLKATRTARNAKITILDHPDSMVIMSQGQLYGVVENPVFDRNRISATLNFDKYVCPPQFLHEVRTGHLKDVSIGFYYQPDFTPGTWHGQPYDYVMRDIVIDHVAAGVLKGRCTYPSCGIGVDTMMRRVSYQEDIVGKRGNEWCVFHCHPDGTRGAVIKCFPTKEEADRMHRAIQAQQHSSALQGYVTNMNEYFLGVAQDKRPPKAWWDNCVSKAQGFADDPARFCNWLWHQGDASMKSSFGRSSVSTLGGKKGKMSLEDLFYPERSKEFNECVAKRMAEGTDAEPPITREQAEAICLAATKPQDEPVPFEKLDQEELSPWQKCIKEQMADGKSREAAEEACKAKGIVKGDQDAAFENCVERKMEGGMPREEAEKECRAEHPVAAEDQDETPEKTQLERCIKNRMETTEDTEEEARTWCEAELAGEHEAADAMLEHGDKLLAWKRQTDTDKRRERLRTL